jgi:hypothetical protein
MGEKIDKTISDISEWIQKEVTGTTIPQSMTPEMIKALAELVTARASIPTNPLNQD